jgi:hypothetical protein
VKDKPAPSKHQQVGEAIANITRDAVINPQQIPQDIVDLPSTILG